MLSDEGLSGVVAPRVVESDQVTADTTEKTVLSVSGPYTSCDLWIAVPVSWCQPPGSGSEPVVMLSVYALLGGLRALVGTVLISDVPVVDTAGTKTGIALSVRGRPSTGFEVTVQSSGTPAGTGVFVLQAWNAIEPRTTEGLGLVGSEPIGAVRGDAHVTILAAKRGDTGDLNARYELLRSTETGLDVRLGETATVAGSGAAGTPTGGVLTVQGPGSGGVLTVQGGGGGGSVFISGTKSPTDFMPTPTDAVDVAAFGLAWSSDSDSWGRVQAVAPSSDVIGDDASLRAASFTLTYNEAASRWVRTRAQQVSGVSAIADSAAPLGLATAAFGYAYDDNSSTWVRIPIKDGALFVTGSVGVGGIVTSAQGAAAGAAGRWPVYLSDGTAAQGTAANPLRVEPVTGGATFGTATNPTHTRLVADRVTYSSGPTILLTGPTTASTAITLGYLFRSTTKRIEIHRILIGYGGTDTTGYLTFRGTRMGAQNATPGGTALSPAGIPFEAGDPAATATFRVPTGASAVAAVTSRSATDLFVIGVKGNSTGQVVWSSKEFGKPIVIRNNVSEGFEIRAFADVGFTTAMRISLTVEWTES